MERTRAIFKRHAVGPFARESQTLSPAIGELPFVNLNTVIVLGSFSNQRRVADNANSKPSSPGGGAVGMLGLT